MGHECTCSLLPLECTVLGPEEGQLELIVQGPSVKCYKGNGGMNLTEVVFFQ